jgi:hypothetical protein
VKTKTRGELVYMMKALQHLRYAQSELQLSQEAMLAGRIGSLASELDCEIGKWEVVAAAREQEER